MGTKSNRREASQQATLKLKGQKLLKMDDGGGLLSSLGGLPLAAQIAEESGLIKMAAADIPEWRDPALVDFKKEELIAQRLFLAASGLPCAIDCSFTKDDPALKAVLQKEPDGPSLSSQSTHTRMEQSMTAKTIEALESVPLKFFFSQKKHAPRELEIYLDGSAIRTFGTQQKSTWRGGKKYSQTQYFPIIATTKDGWLLRALLREGEASDAKAISIIQNLVMDIKAHWKSTAISLTMDTGFNSPELLSYLDEEKIQYDCGYPATTSVLSKIPDVLQAVERRFRKRHGQPKYIDTKGDKTWQKEHERIRALPAQERMAAERAEAERQVREIVEIEHNGVGWDYDRRLIVRVDYTDRGLDVRCVVTNRKHGWPKSIYEDGYCQRARVEMFIKENKSHCKVPLSCMEFTSNQFRFVLQGLAYQLNHLLRLALPKEEQNVSIAGVRKALLLVPVLIIPTARRLRWHLSSVHPHTKTVIRMANKLQNRAA